MRVLTFTLLVIIAITSMAWSQTDKKTDLYLGAGITFPAGPQEFTDYWKMGFNAGGGIGFSLTPAASLIFTVGYAAFPLNESEILKKAGVPSYVNASIDGGTASALDLAGNIKLSLNPAPNRVAAYIVAGAGYFSLSFSDVKVSASYMGYSASETLTFDSESAFSTSFGAGIDIPAGETTSIFIEGRYSIAFTKGDNTSYVPLRAGVRIAL
jgi:hypothetical protein